MSMGWREGLGLQKDPAAHLKFNGQLRANTCLGLRRLGHVCNSQTRGNRYTEKR